MPDLVYISKLDAAYFGSNKTVHTAVGNGVHCNDTEFKKMYSSTYFLKREALEVQIQRVSRNKPEIYRVLAGPRNDTILREEVGATKAVISV